MCGEPVVARSKDQIVMWGGSRTGGTSTLLPLCPRYAVVPRGTCVCVCVCLCAHLGTEEEIQVLFKMPAKLRSRGESPKTC